MGKRALAALWGVGGAGVLAVAVATVPASSASARSPMVSGAVALSPLQGETSCRAILDAGGSTGDGVYTIEPSGSSPYDAYCDMTTDGGGWTAIFAGQNGSPNVFDHFDAGHYTGTFADPSSHYLRRAPVLASAGELAVSCGSAMVKFALTEAARGLTTSGTQAGWIQLTPTVLSGTVANAPNTLWTGSGVNASFIFTRNQGSGGLTFASSFSADNTFDYCNGVFDQASLVRVFYREAPLAPVHNTPGTAGTSCRAILAAGGSGGDGTYWLQQPPDAPYQAYCDMTSDGGGWTAVFAGRNGSTNVFDHFDTGYVGTTSDPGSRYLRRAPVLASAGELAVSCGSAMVKFALTEAARAWMTSGSQAGWVQLTPTVLSGTVPNVPNTLWTGSGGNTSFYFSSSATSGAQTFASSHSATGSTNDYCNGVFDQASLVRVFYRELAPAPVHNTPGTAGTSCRAIFAAGGSGGDGTYWLQQPPADPYQAYCDMTTDGGGWTAIFSGKNGSPNVFDRFDTGYVGTESDPGSRYLRRAPAIASAAELAVSCGSAMVKVALTEAARAWMTSGSQAGWIQLTPTVLSGTVANVPDTLWTGSPVTASFVFSRSQGSGSLTFASSFSGSNAYDHCNGTFDQASLVRVFYRELAPAPVHNTPGTARKSCRAILAAAESGGDGTYWLQQPPDAAYQAYCDMTTDGGGWTAVFAGRNGSTNVFDRFDTGYVGTTSDAGSRYLRRAPASLGDTAAELAVSCGSAMVKFALTNPAAVWMTSGTQAGWIPLTPAVLSGTVSNPPNTLWTGSPSAPSFIFARNQGGSGLTFASSYLSSSQFDHCNGTFDQVSLVRVFYRELAPTAASVALSGRVATPRGAPVAGVKVSVTALTSTRVLRVRTRTDRSGRFRFRLEALTMYEVTPSRTGYRFTPATRVVSVVGPAKISFTARRARRAR